MMSALHSDRDAKQRWAQSAAQSGWGIGGIGGQLLSSAIRGGVSRALGG